MFLISFLGLLGAGLAQGELWTEARVLELFDRGPLRDSWDARGAAVEAAGKNRALWNNPSLVYIREGAGFTEFLQLEQRLSITGRPKLLRESSQAARLASDADRDAELWSIRSDLRLAFYRLLAAQLRHHTISLEIRELDRIVEILRIREELGESARYDRMRAERESADLANLRQLAEAAIAEARGRVTGLLPPGTAIGRVEGDLTLPASTNLDAAIATAMSTRAELQAMRRTDAFLGIENRAAERLRYPEPMVIGGMKRAVVTVLPEVSYAVGVSVPIPSLSRGQYETARLTAEQRSLRSRLTFLEQRVRGDVEGAWESMRIRQDAAQRYRDRVGAMGDQLLEIARVAYQEGSAGILELLDAVRVRREAALRVIDLDLFAKEGQIELDRVCGVEVRQ